MHYRRNSGLKEKKSSSPKNLSSPRRLLLLELLVNDTLGTIGALLPSLLARVDFTLTLVATHPSGTFDLCAVLTLTHAGATTARLEVGLRVETLVFTLSTFDGASGHLCRTEFAILVGFDTVSLGSGRDDHLSSVEESSGKSSSGVASVSTGGRDTLVVDDGGTLCATHSGVSNLLGSGGTADSVASGSSLLAAHAVVLPSGLVVVSSRGVTDGVTVSSVGVVLLSRGALGLTARSIVEVADLGTDTVTVRVFGEVRPAASSLAPRPRRVLALADTSGLTVDSADLLSGVGTFALTSPPVLG